MPSAPLVPILRQLRRLAAGSHAGHSDADLLGRFVRSHDEIAFEEVVRRHGPLVWGVCTRLLRDQHAAEDTFQATFLVLSRKAVRLSRPDALGCWLYGVARRVAGRLRSRSVPAAQPLPDIPDPVSRSPLDVVSGRELTAFLDDELGRLPERLRAPLVLCYLEGNTRNEAAARLDWSLGTLKRRLEQGRNVLRARLKRRCIGLSVALLTLALTEGMASATMPLGLATATVQAASAFGEAAAMSSVPAIIAEAVVRTMALAARLKWAATILLAAGTVAAGMGLALRPAPVEQAKAARPADQAPAPPRVDFYGDPLPEGAVARLGTKRFLGRTVFFGSDGKTVLTTTQRSGIRLLDADSGQELASVPDVHRGPMGARSIDIAGTLPDGKALVSLGSSLPLALWDVRAGQLIRTIGEATGNARVTSATVSSDGQWLACGRQRGPLSVFEIANGQERYQVQPLGVGSWITAFSADSQALAAAESGQPSRIRILNAATGAERERLPDLNNSLRGLALAPNGQLLAWAQATTVSLWDIANRKLLHTWNAQRSGQWDNDNTLAFSPDGKLLAATEDRTGIVLWDTTTRNEVRHWATRNGRHFGLAFSPDGHRLALTGDSNRISIWEVATGRRVAPRQDLATSVTSLAVSPDGRTVVTGHRDAFVRLWETQTGREVQRFKGPFDHVTAVAFGTDGRTVAGGGYEMIEPLNRGGLRWWDVRSASQLGSVDLPDGIFPLTFHSVHDIIFASNFKDSRRFLWDALAGREVVRFGSPEDTVPEGMMSPDGRRFVTGNEKAAVVVWDRETRRSRSMAAPADLLPPEAAARFGLMAPHVAISADGRAVAGAYGRWSIGIWEVGSGLVRLKFGLNEVATPIAFSPDGRTLAYGATSDGVSDFVVLQDMATGMEVARFGSRHRDVGPMRALVFTPDSRFVISGGADTTALVWPVPPPVALPIAVDLDACWADLAGADANQAFTAHWHLTTVPMRTVPFLQNHLHPAQPLDKARHADAMQAIADLDSPRFAVRQQATQKLGQLDELVVPLLKDALTKQPTVETRQRLEQLVDRTESQQASGAELRSLRGLEVLERIDTPQAREVLQRLARGASEAALTREAKAALERTAGSGRSR